MSHLFGQPKISQRSQENCKTNLIFLLHISKFQTHYNYCRMMEQEKPISMVDYFTGIKNSDCFKPCMSTKVSGVITSNQFFSKNFTFVNLAFDSVVKVEEYFYPQFSIVEFLSSIGGSLGLWLGVGVLQITNMISRIMSCIQNINMK